MLCIGEPLVGKSGFLEDMLQIKLELRTPDSYGMFHDSVDLICHSPDLPMKFNVFDFHAKLANHDWDLIRAMFKTLPRCHLFV